MWNEACCSMARNAWIGCLRPPAGNPPPAKPPARQPLALDEKPAKALGPAQAAHFSDPEQAQRLYQRLRQGLDATTRHGRLLTRPGLLHPAPLLNDQGPAGPLFWGTAAHRHGQPSYTGESPAASTIVCTPWHARSAGLPRGLVHNDLFTHGHPNLPADCVQGAHRECAQRLHHLQPALHAARAARGRARCGGRPGVFARGARQPPAPCAARGQFSAGAALRISGRHDLVAIRLRAQCGV